MELKEAVWKIQDFAVELLQRCPDSILGIALLAMSVGFLYFSLTSTVVKY